MTQSGDLLQAPELTAAGHALRTRQGQAAWTDDRSSLLPLVRW